MEKRSRFMEISLCRHTIKTISSLHEIITLQYLVVVLFIFHLALEGLSIVSTEEADENGMFYSFQLSFSHNVSIDTISPSANGATCSNTTSGSNSILINCTNISPDIQHTITVTVMVTFTTGSYSLTFDLGFTVSSTTSPPSPTSK